MAEGSPLPDFAVFAPLMSLPLIFGTTLDVGARARSVPYAPMQSSSARWRAELGPLEAFKIGVAWQGNPRHRRDRERSFRLVQARDASPGFPESSFLDSRASTVSTSSARSRADLRCTSLAERLSDFMDIAAVMQSLDLVIAPDTAIVHLAGAIGVPVWVALPFAPDWRWLDDRSDSPWYPSMRLFRQQRWGDWDDVFERMADELPQLIAARKNRLDQPPAG